VAKPVLVAVLVFEKQAAKKFSGETVGGIIPKASLKSGLYESPRVPKRE
jgi:hypothetical protein